MGKYDPPFRHFLLHSAFLLFIQLFCRCALAQSVDTVAIPPDVITTSDDTTSAATDGASPSPDSISPPPYLKSAPAVVLPVVPVAEKPPSITWSPLLHQSLYYLAIMHGFRLATEPGTRDGLHNGLVGGYFDAVSNLHGYADGDPGYVNYLGHPLQGVVSSYIWIQNDPRYRAARFGSNRDYWMSRLRAYAFAWAFSEQFEIGPISEASIGQVQRYYHQQGFVDHIITPNLGISWVLAEDALDEHIVRPLEQRYTQTWLRIALRTALNPGQSMANVLAGSVPWHRDTRPGVLSYALGSGNPDPPIIPANPSLAVSKIPRFDLSPTAEFFQVGGKPCYGGGAVAGYRLADNWQWTAEVTGCALSRLDPNWNGDSLTFLTGPQWSSTTNGRLNWNVHSRIGGQKITQEHIDPAEKAIVEALPPLGPNDNPNTRYSMYAKEYDTTGLALSIGGGLEVPINHALGLQVANVEYVHSWLAHLNGIDFNQGFRITSGFTLHIGTW